MTKHKPCPFCGGTADVFILWGKESYSFIKCSDCKVKTEIYKTERAAWVAWDRRVKDEEKK